MFHILLNVIFNVFFNIFFVHFFNIFWLFIFWSFHRLGSFFWNSSFCLYANNFLFIDIHFLSPVERNLPLIFSLCCFFVFYIFFFIFAKYHFFSFFFNFFYPIYSFFIMLVFLIFCSINFLSISFFILFY